MKFSFINSAYGDLHFLPGLPPGFKGPLINGSRQQYYAGEYGAIVKQEITYESFCFNVFHFELTQTLKVKCLLPKGLQSLLVYRGECRWKFTRFFGTRLKAFQFMLFYYRGEACSVDLADNKPLQLLHATYSPEFIQELLPAFPEQESFLHSGIPKTIRQQASHQAIREVVHQILYAEYEPSRLPYYHKNKISEYLFLVMDQFAGMQADQLVPTEQELAAVYKVKEIILSDILHHHVISELAKKVKINPNRLKQIFKKEFGIGPYGFLLQARLDKVKELMEEGMPMKVAAPLAGYRTTSFITAFKRRYGYSPGIIKPRKEKKDTQ